MIFTELMNYVNPRVPKRILLFVAAIVWSYASYRVFLLCLNLMKDLSRHFIVFLVGSATYLIFFRYVFLPVLQRHTKRILNKDREYVCVFSFFDLKSYLIMALMISLGVISKRYFNLPPFVMSSFFVALSFSLFTSSIYFIYYGIRYHNAVSKFKN
ncbi:hypothetical protein ACFLRI_00790 [Bacteroidota bacterium]